MSWITITLISVGAVAGLLVLIALLITWVGSRQPIGHTAARQLRLPLPPEAVWAVLRDHAREAEWNGKLRAVERLPDRDGREVWRLHFRGAGNPPCTLETVESVPPRRLVRTIVDDKMVFFGRWEFDLAAAADGSILTLTEHGEIPNPFFRGMFQLLANPAAQVESFLRELARKLGAAPQIVEASPGQASAATASG